MTRRKYLLLEWLKTIAEILVAAAAIWLFRNPILEFAVSYNAPPITKAMLGIGAEANTVDGGVPILNTAAAHGNTANLLALLSHGAKIDAQDEFGATAVMAAAEQGQVQTTQLLLTHGANVIIKNHQGQTAQMLAKENKHSEIAKLLRKEGGSQR